MHTESRLSDANYALDQSRNIHGNYEPHTDAVNYPEQSTRYQNRSSNHQIGYFYEYNTIQQQQQPYGYAQYTPYAYQESHPPQHSAQYYAYTEQQTGNIGQNSNNQPNNQSNTQREYQQRQYRETPILQPSTNQNVQNSYVSNASNHSMSESPLNSGSNDSQEFEDTKNLVNNISNLTINPNATSLNETEIKTPNEYDTTPSGDTNTNPNNAYVTAGGLSLEPDIYSDSLTDLYGFGLSPRSSGLIRPLTPVRPCTPGFSPIQSKCVLFLDVDGVLLSTEDQKKLRNGDPIPFDPIVAERMSRIAQTTNCDIVISSTWQFHPDHLLQLREFLRSCGWKDNQIHTLVSTLGQDITRVDYEKAPYCQSRSRGILKMINKHSTVKNWVAVDDLPLDSSSRVCVPKKEDLERQTHTITETYLRFFEGHVDVESWYTTVFSGVYSALTTHPIALFSWKSMLFGFELRSEMIRTQARTIIGWIPLSQYTDSDFQMQILEALIKVLKIYCRSRCGIQGYPSMSDHFVPTDARVGLTEENTERIIEMLLEKSDGDEMLAAVLSPRSSPLMERRFSDSRSRLPPMRESSSDSASE